jgi:lysophospholipase L1-like esterase
MSSMSRSLWYASLPLLPTLALQGAYVALRAQRLPEADGARRGLVGEGERRYLSMIGESTAAGVGVMRQSDGLAAQLAGSMAKRWDGEVQWQVAGRNGATMADLHLELSRELREPLGTVVVVGGVNDTVKLTTRRRFADHVRQLHRTLRSRGALHVVFCAVPPMAEFPLLPQPLRSLLGLRSSLLDQRLRELVAGCTHASHAPIGALQAADNMASDGFHPNVRGYTAWANLLAEHLSSLP